jgi:hypothetical protein
MLFSKIDFIEDQMVDLPNGLKRASIGCIQLVVEKIYAVETITAPSLPTASDSSRLKIWEMDEMVGTMSVSTRFIKLYLTL